MSNRMQQRGALRCEGGWWKLRWRVESEGQPRRWSATVRIGPSKGPNAITKTEARRRAWEDHLSKLDDNLRLTPKSLWTLRQFVEQRFIPERVAPRKPSTRAGYRTQLAHMLDGAPLRPIQSKGLPGRVDVRRQFGLGSLALSAVDLQHVHRLLAALDEAGYSSRAVQHVRSVIFTVFEYAEACGYWAGINPAKHAQLPEPEPARLRHALTAEQATQVLSQLTSPYREMVLTGILTGMNVAELCGLRWGRVNLTDATMYVNGEPLAPRTLAVREQYMRRFGYGTVKAKKRRREIPLAGPLLDALQTLYNALSAPVDLEAPVFATLRGGRPIDADEARKRHLKPAGAAFGMPWLTWHDLRRTFATLTDAQGLSPSQRQALLGHATASMTSHYTLAATEGTRAALNALAQQLTPSQPQGVETLTFSGAVATEHQKTVHVSDFYPTPDQAFSEELG